MPVNGLKFGSGNMSDYLNFLNGEAKASKRKLVEEERALGNIDPKGAVESSLKGLAKDTAEFRKSDAAKRAVNNQPQR